MAYKKYYDRNREKILARERANYKVRVAKYIAEHRCRHCGTKLDDDYQYRNCVRCLAQFRRHTDKIMKPLKDAAFIAYGGYVCNCCGETEPIFLSIDHIDGGGYEHRKTIHAGYSMYSWLKREGYPNGFQILCRNCNWGKHINNGICPHKKIKMEHYGHRTG